jgi:hypothetical protein
MLLVDIDKTPKGIDKLQPRRSLGRVFHFRTGDNDKRALLQVKNSAQTILQFSPVDANMSK